MKPVVALVVLMLACAGCSSGGGGTTKAAAPGRFVGGTCPHPAGGPIPALANARCGVLIVPESRTNFSGRTIRLPVFTVPAKSATPAPDPVVYLAGGPGNDAVLFAQTLVDANVNRDRDLILMSVRGAAMSKPSLVCPELDQFETASLGLVYDAPSTGQQRVDAARACRQRILSENKGIDLSAYNSTEAANDYADLRTALGINEWNVFGHSYGTDLALTLARTHPDGIRTMTLDGVVPPSDASPVVFPWKSAKAAFDAVFQACAAQPPCAARYPNLSQRFVDLVNKLEANPIRTTGTLPNGSPTPVVIDGGVLANWMLLGMHHPADVPGWLDELANGHPEKIAQQWIDREAADPLVEGVQSQGFAYGVWCSEWVPYSSPSTELDEVRQVYPGLPDSVLAQGPQLPFLRQTCEQAWPVVKAPAAVRDVPQTNIRTLIMSGTFDAQTGPQWADLVAAKLPNSLNLKFPGVAAGPFVTPCGQQVTGSFWTNPGTPDTSCVASVTAPPFVIG